MEKRKARRAIDVAIEMGFVPEKFVVYGNKALVGQFVRKRVDYSAIINAARAVR